MSYICLHLEGMTEGCRAHFLEGRQSSAGHAKFKRALLLLHQLGHAFEVMKNIKLEQRKDNCSSSDLPSPSEGML